MPNRNASGEVYPPTFGTRRKSNSLKVGQFLRRQAENALTFVRHDPKHQFGATIQHQIFEPGAGTGIIVEESPRECHLEGLQSCLIERPELDRLCFATQVVTQRWGHAMGLDKAIECLERGIGRTVAEESVDVEFIRPALQAPPDEAPALLEREVFPEN